MITYSIPDDPRFEALRREAEHYLGPGRAALPGAGAVPGGRLHLEVSAGRGDGEAYTLVRTERGVAVRGDGVRGAGHGFHHALRLMGFGFSFFADSSPRPRNPTKPRELKLAWSMRSPEVRVTIISPGVVETELGNDISDATAKQALGEFRKVSLTPDAIARAIAYAVEQPDDVDVNEVIVRPTASAF